MRTRTTVLLLVAVVALLQTASVIGQTGRANTRPGSVVTSAISQPTGTAVLSVASGLATQPGTVNPLAGSPLVLFKESFGDFLRRKGMFQGPPGSSVKESPLAVWAYACRTGSPACKQALHEMRPASVGEAKMDVNGRATLPGVPAESYYLFTVANYNNQFLVWDLRVDLKPGANSVILDQRNIAPLAADSTSAKSPAGGSQSGALSQPCPVKDAPRAAKPDPRANSFLSVSGGYTYTVTDGTTGKVKFTEKGNFAGTTFYLVDDDVENVLAQAGIQPGLLGSRLAMVGFFDAGTQVENVPGMSLLASTFGQGQELAAITKQAKADFDCAMKAIAAHSVRQTTIGPDGRGRLYGIPAGTYYLYGSFYRVKRPVRAGGMVWNLKVTLKPGSNVLKLSPENAAYTR